MGYVSSKILTGDYKLPQVVGDALWRMGAENSRKVVTHFSPHESTLLCEVKWCVCTYKHESNTLTSVGHLLPAHLMQGPLRHDAENARSATLGEHTTMKFNGVNLLHQGNDYIYQKRQQRRP